MYVFRPLMHFIINMNELTDIVNTWDPHTKENGLECHKELLRFLTWMQKWKNYHDERVKVKTRTEWNFFAGHGTAFECLLCCTLF